MAGIYKMDTFFCIYSGREWPESERSSEHIIPFSIGGSNKFVINDVAVQVNNTIGSKADAPLVNNFGFVAERNRLKLKSEKGNIPSIDLSGEIDINGEKVKIRNTIDKDERGKAKLIPKIEVDWEKGTISGISDPDDYDNIVKNIQKKAVVKGFTVSFPRKPKLDKIDNPTIQGKVKFELHSYEQGFVKIALGTGHFALGYDWSKGIDAARMRDVLADVAPVDFEKHQLHGYTYPNHDAKMVELMKIDDNHHIIALINTEKMLACYCLLFGKYDALIKMQDGFWKNDANSLPEGGFVYVVNVVNRTLKILKYRQYLSTLSSLRLGT